MPVLLGQGSVWRRVQTVIWGDRGRISLQIHSNTRTQQIHVRHHHSLRCKYSSHPFKPIKGHTVLSIHSGLLQILRFQMNFHLMAVEQGVKQALSHLSYMSSLTETNNNITYDAQSLMNFARFIVAFANVKNLHVVRFTSNFGVYNMVCTKEHVEWRELILLCVISGWCKLPQKPDRCNHTISLACPTLGLFHTLEKIKSSLFLLIFSFSTFWKP